MKVNRRLRVLSFIVIGYMLMALLWWAVLLYRKNHEAFELKLQLIELEFADTNGAIDLDVRTLQGYPQLKADYERQLYMIFGEALVFGLTLIIGIFFINRAYVRELLASQKQKNFLLSITHELKSPLASINLILDTFIKRTLPEDKIKELSQDGLKESTRLEELFNKILISTRLDEAYPFNFEKIDLSYLVKTTVDQFNKLHPDVTIEQNITSDIYHKVDQESIVSVLKNLLENAYKYSSSNKKINIQLTNSFKNILLTVEDNGIGIPKEERERIFEQFYRIGNEDTRNSKGTGLGLYIVNEIIRAHDGKIKVSNSASSGTIFTITL